MRGTGSTAASDKRWLQGVRDAAAGVAAAAERHPALMNPETMRHIAANIPLWAEHQRMLRVNRCEARTDVFGRCELVAGHAGCHQNAMKEEFRVP